MKQARQAAAHHEAFTSVLKYIQVHAIEQNDILWLSSLWHMYIDELEQHGFPNSD
jgi:hypothetical protein